MRRSFLGLAIFACLCLAYVQQRVILVSLGYQVERLRHLKDDLLDQHRVLHYNVLILQSPVILDRRLTRSDVELSVPQQVEVLFPRVTPTAVPAQKESVVSEGTLLQQVRRFAAQWLEGVRQAEAKPVPEERTRW